jgi:hypothetical protein
MATWSRTIGGGEDYFLDFFIGATTTAGGAVVRAIAAASHAEIEDPADVNSLDLAIGVTPEAVTYNATPTTEPAVKGFTIENMARVMCSPHAIWRFPASGGTASGTVLQPSTATPANILSNDNADTGTPDLVTDAAVGTIDMVGGLLKGRTGNNTGAIRRISVHSDNTSTTAGIDFINDIAAGDTFIRVPWSRAVVEMEMTTDFVEANAIEQTADGNASVGVVHVHIDEQNDTAYVEVVFADHWLKPIAAGADLS